MACPIRVGERIDPSVFAEIRREMELTHCKWDAQVGDISTLAPFPIMIGEADWRELEMLAEALAEETTRLESALAERPELHPVLGLPRSLASVFQRGTSTPAAARVMRFDFHWTTDGWRISEVNSDVPGGFTEATSFTRLMAVPGTRVPGDPTAAVVEALAKRDGVIALMNAPGHMEDHQVVAYLAKRLREAGVVTEVIAPSHLRWMNGEARIESGWTKAKVGAIYRFYQAEWLPRLPASVAWQPMFVDGRTPVANPGVSTLSESKRLPLLWDRLGVPVPTWRRLLPETRALADAPWSTSDAWLIKTAYSNTGDTVSARALLPRNTWRLRTWSARLRPGRWVAQRRFEVVPLLDGEAPIYPCVGVYTVDGKAAGAYVRVSRGPVIDAHARDVALLVEP